MDVLNCHVQCAVITHLSCNIKEKQGNNGYDQCVPMNYSLFYSRAKCSCNQFWSMLARVSFSRLIVTNVAACLFPAFFRFHVLSKLLSFMAPIDHTTMNDDAR